MSDKSKDWKEGYHDALMDEAEERVATTEPQLPEVAFGTPPQEEETEFAHGGEIETQNIRVTYMLLNRETKERFPQIYKTHGDNSVTNLGLTPAEGRYLAKVLTQMFAKEKP